MIVSLIQIGRATRDVYTIPFVEIPYKDVSESKDKPRLIVVELANQDDELKFEGIYLADYSVEDAKNKYFFRSGKSKGAAPTLSFKLPPKSSTLRERLKVLDNLGYRVNEEELSIRIEEFADRLRKEKAIGKNVLVVLKIDGKWPSENERLVTGFIEETLRNLGDNKFRKFWKVESICHGCGQKKIVYGGVGDLLKFYTVDKYGYAPSLNPKYAWKQYGLCKECILDLERGKRAVDEFLKWNFYGKEFWLLPVSTGNLRTTLEEFKNFYSEIKGKSHKEGYESIEDRLIYEASVREEVTFYHFVFVKAENQAFRILLHIEEVLPSVLAQYVYTKREVEDDFNNFLHEFINNNESFRFNFFTSPDLKATKQKQGFTDEDFFMLVDKVFRRSPVDERYLISKAMSRISKDMAETGEQGRIPRWSVLETLLSLEFLLKWGILKRKTGGVEMNSSPYAEFFERHGDFFNHPAKRALVLLGVIVQKFLNYQYKERNSTPFMKVLKNLRLDQKDVQSIFTALQNKMNEYGIGHWWPELREGISLYFIEGGDKWPLSPDEIGFYIAVGMSLHSHPVFGERHEAS